MVGCKPAKQYVLLILQLFGKTILSQILKEEIEEFDKLSKDEAKKKAQEDLKEIGFLDDQGNVTEPYIALRQECTARNHENKDYPMP